MIGRASLGKGGAVVVIGAMMKSSMGLGRVWTAGGVADQQRQWRSFGDGSGSGWIMNYLQASFRQVGIIVIFGCDIDAFGKRRSGAALVLCLRIEFTVPIHQDFRFANTKV
jgi:hypothetical protein